MAAATNEVAIRSWNDPPPCCDNGPMFYRFAVEVPLRWVDVDSAGVVNNATYLSLMEQARFAYFKELGLLRGHHVPFVLAETNVQFLKPGRLGMRTEVAAATTRLGNSSFEMRYEVRSGDEVLAKASATLVFVDQQLQSCSIPEPFRATVAQFEELA